jgi:hypothetical protein
MLVFQKIETPTSTVFSQKNRNLTFGVIAVFILLYLFLPRFLSSGSISLTRFSVPDLIILMALYAAWEVGPLYMAVNDAQNRGKRVTKTGNWLVGDLQYEIEKV